jgi:fructose-1,6-bisphosphatase I
MVAGGVFYFITAVLHVWFLLYDGYCIVLYLILNCSGGEANGYTLDPNIGEFLLTHPAMKIGKKKIYSLNEGSFY